MSTASNLRLARAGIANRNRWTMGRMLNNCGQMCALGSVAKALGVSEGTIRDEKSNVYDALRHTPEVRLLGQAAVVVVPNRRQALTAIARVYGLNDDGSHENVLKMFDVAINLAESSRT